MEEKRGQSVRGRREGEKTKSLFRVLEGDGQDGGGVRWRGGGQRDSARDSSQLQMIDTLYIPTRWKEIPISHGPTWLYSK